MSNSFATRMSCAIGAAAISALCPQLGVAAACTDATAMHGPHNFYCVDLTGSKSYCLRPDSTNPRNVRQLPGIDKLLTESFVRVDKVYTPKPPDPCANVPIPGSAQLSEGDVVRIVKQKGKYLMQIWHSDGSTMFPAPLVMKPGSAGPGGKPFYLSTEKPQSGFDYFVLLADDDLGQPGAANVARIEKYFDIEVFPKESDPKNSCDLARPSVLANFKPWKTGDTDCTQAKPMEAGTGTGGSNYP